MESTSGAAMRGALALLACASLLLGARGDLVEEGEQLLRAGDADGDGEVSREDLQQWLMRFQDGGTAEGPWAVDHAGLLAAEATAGRLLDALDTDGSRGLNATELSTAGALLRAHGGAADLGGNGSAVRASLRARARAAPTREEAVQALEQALEGKVEDERCQGKPEGWLCLSATRLMYCSAGKRLQGERSCGFEGRCKPGVLGTGGCDYPWCDGRVHGGRFCRGQTVYRCAGESANGRAESVSHRLDECRHGRSCREWHDGPPPSRRRRTCNGGRSCYYGCGGHHDECRVDPEDPPYAACD